MTAWADLLRPPLREIGAYRPGESLDELMARHGLEHVDKLNWNEGLWGPLPGVLDAVAAALDQAWAYPEHAYNELREAIAGDTGADPGQILPGHGIQALVLTLVNAFVTPGDRVVVAAPTYGLYAQAARVAGATVEHVGAPGLALDLERMAGAVARTGARLVFVCDPNNPTGLRVGPDEWRAFLEAVGPDCVVVADEAYMDYVDPGERVRREDDVADGRRVIVLRTFSKIFGLAGLRLGYLLADPALVHYLHSVQEPFNVNRAALAAGAASLGRPDELRGRRELAAASRDRLAGALRAGGMVPVESSANFVLVDLGVDDEELAELLVGGGVLIRPGSELGMPGWARITVGPADVMDRAAAALLAGRAELLGAGSIGGMTIEATRARTTTGGRAAARALAAHGVDVVWGIPGTHNLELYAGLREAGIRHLSPRHEQGAAFAADGFSRVTGRPGVCVTTSGPAVLNAATAIGQAYSDSIPVLLVAAGMPLRNPGLGSGDLHETKDLVRAMDAVAGYAHRVTSVEEIPVAIAQAFARMATGRPRPVVVEIPYDLMAEQGEAPEVTPVATSPVVPAEAALDAAAEALAGAARPAMIVGGGASRAADGVRAMAERLGAPVVTSINGKGTLPEDHPLSLGAGLAATAARDLVEDADVVLVVGCELAPSDLWWGPLPLDGKAVRVDVDPAQAVTNAVPVATVIGDAALALDGLLGRLGDGAAADEERATRFRAAFRAQAAGDAERWSGLLEAIAGALGRDGVLATDNAQVAYLGALGALPAYAPRSFLFPSGYGTLGFAIPAGMGAKVGRPDAPVVALTGDGGVMFTIGELASAAQAGLALPVVVADNGGYGEIRHEMRERGDEPLGVDFDSPDFAALGRAMGCHGVTADSPAALRDALGAALGADRPTVIQVRTD